MTRDGGEADADVSPGGDDALKQLRGALLTVLGTEKLSKLNHRALAALLVVAEGRVPPTVRHLAAHLDTPKPAISRAFDTLESLGLLKRKDDPEDRRSMLVVLTRSGEAVLKRVGLASSTGSGTRDR